jgi:hypothetical protein
MSETHVAKGGTASCCTALFMEAAEVAGVSQTSIAADVRELMVANDKGGAFVGRALEA